MQAALHPDHVLGRGPETAMLDIPRQVHQPLGGDVGHELVDALAVSKIKAVPAHAGNQIRHTTGRDRMHLLAVPHELCEER